MPRTVGRAGVEPPTATESQVELVPADSQLCLQIADRVVRDIFAVSLTLASVRSLTAGVASARLDEAISDLDGLVRGFHARGARRAVSRRVVLSTRS